MDGAAVLHQALAGETFLEKERRLSEMIRQLQMVREQLLNQQEQQTKVGNFALQLVLQKTIFFHVLRIGNFVLRLVLRKINFSTPWEYELCSTTCFTKENVSTSLK